MNGNVAWIVAGLLALVGIVAFLMSGSSSLGADLETQTKTLLASADLGVHSSASLGDLRTKRDAIQQKFNARASEIASDNLASIETSFDAVLGNMTTKSKDTKFKSVQWPSLKDAFEARIKAIRTKTQRPPAWNALGHRWIESLGLYENEIALLGDVPFKESGMRELSEKIEGANATSQWVSRDKADQAHFGQLAVVALDRILKAIENELDDSLANKVFYVENFNFSMLEPELVGDTYGSDDISHRWNCAIDYYIAPGQHAAFLAALNAALDASSGPSMRLVGITTTFPSPPQGIMVTVTPEESAELGFPVPTTRDGFQEWQMLTRPKIEAAITEARLHAVELPMKVKLTIQLSVIKDNPTALQSVTGGK